MKRLGEKDSSEFLTQEQASPGLLAHAHCTAPGQGPVLGLKPEMKGFAITIRTVHTTQGHGQSTIVFYWARPGPGPGPVLMQCE